jgi:CRP-like cAMP-binding protein
MIKDLIRSTWLLRDLTDDEISTLATLAEKMSASPGTHLVERNKKNEYLWILGRGSVGVSSDDDKSFVARLHEGDLFGEMSWLDGQPASTSLRAIDAPTELIRLSFKNFDRFLYANPDAHINILRKFAINLSHRLRSK